MNNTASLAPAAVVRKYLDTFFRKNVEETLECLTDDVVWKVQGADDVPTVGVRRGKEEVRVWLGLFPIHFRPLDFHIAQFFESGNDVVVTGRFKHFIVDTGRDFESDFAALCSVRDGKISAYNFIEDSYALWAAFQP